MKKIFLLLILFQFNYCLNAQQYIAQSLAGYNRVGVYLNPSFSVKLNHHHLNFGLNIYGYNLFFQSNNIGVKLGYGYIIKSINEKVYFYPSINIAAYREDKITSSLLLFETNLKYGLAYYLKPKLSLVTELGMGYIMTKTELFQINKTKQNAYTNFEISLGLAYHFTRAK